MSSIFDDKRIKDFVIATERKRDIQDVDLGNNHDCGYCPDCGEELQETGSTTYCVDCGWFDSGWAE